MAGEGGGEPGEGARAAGGPTGATRGAGVEEGEGARVAWDTLSWCCVRVRTTGVGRVVEETEGAGGGAAREERGRVGAEVEPEEAVATGTGWGRTLARRCVGFLALTCKRKSSSVAAISAASVVSGCDSVEALRELL